MPLPAIVGGSIIKVGGSIATATAINAIFAALSKLRLPKSKIQEILIDKVIEYTVNQLTASTDSQIENLELVSNVITTDISIDIPLDSLSRIVILNAIDYPIGIGRRFSDRVPGGLPDRFLFGALSFGGNTTIKDSFDNDLVIDVGLSNEIDFIWEKQSFLIPKLGTSNFVSKAFLYLLPNMSARVDILKVKE